MITELEFKSLAAQGYNRIPLMLEAFADLETPLSLYLKLANAKDGGKYSFLLESVVGGERFGRYSFIGLPARTLLRASGFGAEAVTQVVTDGEVVETSRVNPLDFISDYQKRFKVALRPGLPRFCGGLAGYFGYDAVRYIEKKLEKSCPPDTLGCPDILLLQCEELAVIDNLSGKLYLIVYADPARPEAYANAKKRLRELKEQLKYSVSAPSVKPSQGYPAEREFAKADYIAAVERAKKLIEGGDFMQVQTGQRAQRVEHQVQVGGHTPGQVDLQKLQQHRQQPARQRGQQHRAANPARAQHAQHQQKPERRVTHHVGGDVEPRPVRRRQRRQQKDQRVDALRAPAIKREQARKDDQRCVGQRQRPCGGSVHRLRTV